MQLPQPNEAFAWVQAPPGPALVCRPLEQIAPHFFTTRSWPLGSTAPDANQPEWDDVARAAGVEPGSLRRLRQVHGADIVVTRRRAGDALRDAHEVERPEADIILTDDPAIAVAVQIADCVPLLIGDRRTGVVAAAHAGWRGLAAGVPRIAVEAVAREFGSRPGDLVAAIGPSIGAPRYEVGADVHDRFERAGFEAMPRWFSDAGRGDHWYFDGCQSARDQLVGAGLDPNAVHVAGLCTASHSDLLCSFRRDGSARAGRMAAVIRARGADETAGRERRAS